MSILGQGFRKRSSDLNYTHLVMSSLRSWLFVHAAYSYCWVSYGYAGVKKCCSVKWRYIAYIATVDISGPGSHCYDCLNQTSFIRSVYNLEQKNSQLDDTTNFFIRFFYKIMFVLTVVLLCFLGLWCATFFALFYCFPLMLRFVSCFRSYRNIIDDISDEIANISFSEFAVRTKPC